MSDLEDQGSLFFPKNERMIWSRKFIGAWLGDPEEQFIAGNSLDSLATVAKFWIQRTAIRSHQRYPIVSSEDLREAVLVVLGSEEASQLKGIDRLKAILQNSEPPCQCRTCSLQRSGFLVV